MRCGFCGGLIIGERCINCARSTDVAYELRLMAMRSKIFEDRACFKKRRFVSRAEAVLFASRFLKKSKDSSTDLFYPYHCLTCGRWHLSKRTFSKKNSEGRR